MKEGWTYKKLGEVATIVGGSTPKSNIKEFWGGTNYWVTPANLDGNKYQGATPRTITDLAVQKTNLKLLPTGTVLLSSRAPIGKIAITTVPMYCNQGFKNIICSNHLINEFVYWYLYGKIDYLNSLGKGATFKEISKKDTEQIEIPVPPIAEQQRIVDYLNATFEQIDELKNNAERQLAEARALFQSALTQAMQPKPDWQEKKLKEIGITQTGTTPSKIDKSNYGEYIPFIRPSEIDFDGCGNIDYNSEMKLSEKGLSIGRLFKKSSILMVCIGATISKVGFSTQDVSCNQQINVLYPNDQYHYKFIYYAMRNDDFKKKVIKDGTSAQATLPIINKSKWENLSLFLPNLSEQQEIAVQLDKLLFSVRELEEINRKTVAECDVLKQAMLRQIFD